MASMISRLKANTFSPAVRLGCAHSPRASKRGRCPAPRTRGRAAATASYKRSTCSMSYILLLSLSMVLSVRIVHLICKKHPAFTVHPHPAGQAQARRTGCCGFCRQTRPGSPYTPPPAPPAPRRRQSPAAISPLFRPSDLCGRAAHHAAQACKRHAVLPGTAWCSTRRRLSPAPRMPGAPPFCLSSSVWGAWSVAMASTSPAQHGARSARPHPPAARMGGFTRKSLSAEPDVVGRHLAGDAHTPAPWRRGYRASASLVLTWHMCSCAPVDWQPGTSCALSPGFPPGGSLAAERSISSAWLMTVRPFSAAMRMASYITFDSRARLCRPR